jgi:Histidine kinase-, DNA gyrase B-, and HSP90-like ATPase
MIISQAGALPASPFGLSNAIKFTPKGGSIWLNNTLEANGSLVISVRDSGVGMRADEIHQALEPIGQAPNALTLYREGTGLGLPLAIQLTELHGGSLTIASSPGQGTTVSVCHSPVAEIGLYAEHELAPLPIIAELAARDHSRRVERKLQSGMEGEKIRTEFVRVHVQWPREWLLCRYRRSAGLCG